MKKILNIFSALVLSLFLTTTSNAVEKWDMPMAYSATNFHSQNGVMFADAVRIATGGEIDITVHPGGSLFKGGEIKKAIQTGQVPIGERLLSGHQNESLIFGTDSIPFLATSYEDSAKLWKHLRPELEKILDKQGLVLLYGVPWPSQGLYFNKEINSVADTKGIKFRSYNNSTARIAELMGMLPVQVEAAELSQALATGVASSFVSSGATGYDRKVWEHLSHFYEVNAWLPRNYVMVNKKTWNKLSEKNRNIIMGVAKMAEAAGTARSEQLSGWYLTQLAANGMTVTKAQGQLRSDLESIGKTMSDEWIANAGSVGQKIIDGFRSEK
jgi:TRAP-type C4-dicarboxylate transport system substrate-binding protein|tara:strand:- start:2206 stop:3186 length:981 start_codon:yes stop_codon:yes gene_type:complete